MSDDEIKKLADRLRAFFTETRMIEVSDVHAAADLIENLKVENVKLKEELANTKNILREQSIEFLFLEEKINEYEGRFRSLYITDEVQMNEKYK